MEEPGRLQSMGSQRVGPDWATSLHFTWNFIKVLLTLVFRKHLQVRAHIFYFLLRHNWQATLCWFQMYNVWLDICVNCKMITTSLVNICQHMQLQWASQVALAIKNPPADAGGRQEIWVQPMGRENTLGEGLAIHSSSLAWRISWTEELGGIPSIGSQRVGHDWSNSVCMHSRTQAVTIFFPPWVLFRFTLLATFSYKIEY